MIETTARWSSGFFLYAALQFAVLTGVAMQLYPGYRFGGHFFSDLGATRTWFGEPNHLVVVLFGIAVVTLGAGMIGFAAAWRDYAFARRRAAGVGRASQICGTLSGLAFIGVAFAPMNVVLDLHNALVVLAFGLLLAFAACMTAVWWKNGAPGAVIVAGVLYLVLLVGFFAAAIWVVTTEFRHLRVLIVGQKIAIYASIAYVVFLTLTIRNR